MARIHRSCNWQLRSLIMSLIHSLTHPAPETGRVFVASATFSHTCEMLDRWCRHKNTCARAHAVQQEFIGRTEADTAHHATICVSTIIMHLHFVRRDSLTHNCTCDCRCSHSHSTHAASVSCAGFSQCQGYLRTIGTLLRIVPSHRAKNGRAVNTVASLLVNTVKYCRIAGWPWADLCPDMPDWNCVFTWSLDTHTQPLHDMNSIEFHWRKCVGLYRPPHRIAPRN